MPFTEIPILDLDLARLNDTKAEFLASLREALLNVGFLYLKNAGIEQELYDEVCKEGISFFDLPDEEKLRIEMKNQPSFLGYSRVSRFLRRLRFEYRNLMRLPSWEMRSPPNVQTGANS